MRDLARMAACGLLCCLTASACAAPMSAPAQNEEPVMIRALSIGDEPAYLDEIYERLDELTLRDLNCIVRITYIPWGNERQAIDSAIASGEYDIYCNGVFSNYREQIAKNAFLDLNPYLELVPELTERYARISETTLQECEINGALYGFPEIRDATSIRDGVILYRDDLREEWGLEEMDSLDDLEEYLYRAREDERYSAYPFVTDNRIWQSLFYILGGQEYLEITSLEDMPYAVIAIDDPYQVVCRMETDAFYEVLEYVQKWYQDGIIDPAILGTSDNEGTRGRNMLTNDQKPCETNSTLSAVQKYFIPRLHDAHPEWTWNFYFFSQENPVYRCSLANGTCTSVSSRSLHPEEAIRFIGLAHTDREYYDLLRYGIEGVHYELEDGWVSYENVAASLTRPSWTGLPDSFMDYPEKLADESWNARVESFQKEYAAVERAGDHPLLGISIDSSNLPTQELERAWNTYMKPLVCGVTDDLEGDYALAMEKMYEAGLAEYLQAIQYQVTVYHELGGSQ